MTLVGTSVNDTGIVMVAESAISPEESSTSTRLTGATKLFFSESQKIGVAAWGRLAQASLLEGEDQFDKWLHSEIKALSDEKDLSVEAVANRLGAQLWRALNRRREPRMRSHGSSPWALHRCGLLVAGFKNRDRPEVWHVYTPDFGGGCFGPPTIRCVYREFRVRDAGPGLRLEGPWGDKLFWNGEQAAFDHVEDNVAAVERGEELEGSDAELQGRAKAYIDVVRRVSERLTDAGNHSVNDDAYGLAFHREGLMDGFTPRTPSTWVEAKSNAEEE